MGGDVFLPRKFKRIFAGLMFGKGAQGSAAAVNVVIFGSGETVVDEQKQAINDDFGDVAQKGEIVGAHFRLIVHGILADDAFQFSGEGRCGCDVLREPIEIGGNVEFLPTGLAAADEMEGQGIEDFISENNSRKRVQLIDIGSDAESGGERVQALVLGIPKPGKRLKGGVFKALPGGW